MNQCEMGKRVFYLLFIALLISGFSGCCSVFGVDCPPPPPPVPISKFPPANLKESNICIEMVGFTFASGLQPDAKGEPNGNGIEMVKKSWSGSGFILNEDGVIATNYHVAKRALASFEDGSKFDIQHIKFYDSANDIAILRMGGTKKFSPVKLGNSDAEEIGNKVYAVGNTLGQGLTVSDGIISQIIKDTDNKNEIAILKHTASIAPGNSGGPLYHDDQVVGINVATRPPFQVHYAIPVNKLKTLMNEGGEFHRLEQAFQPKFESILAKAKAGTPKLTQVDAASSEEPGIWAAAAEFQTGDDLIISVLGQEGSSLDILILNPETKKVIGFGKSVGNVNAVLIPGDQHQKALITVLNTQKRPVKFAFSMAKIEW